MLGRRAPAGGSYVGCRRRPAMPAGERRASNGRQPRSGPATHVSASARTWRDERVRRAWFR
ncbi:hypothetical protein DB771_21205 [Burkholderia sp. AU29985]|nr:hypothetical protein EGY28_07830 [Burkholderia dolosa]PRE49925.1 hypothetical protein C6P87_13270 [Burkholderia sp. AU12872]PUA74820.1 hypothetical protein DB771_21205 [Burkholderia sp. AU29985]